MVPQPDPPACDHLLQAMQGVWRTYLVVSAIDWLMLGLMAWAAVHWLDLSGTLAVAAVAAWIVKDLLLYPSARWYYTPEPPGRRMIGEQGQALSRIDPQGFARVHGEIWQVRVEPGAGAIAEGETLRVRGIDGLRLLVEPAGRSWPDRPPAAARSATAPGRG